VGVISMQVFPMVDAVKPDLDCRSLALEGVAKPILLPAISKICNQFITFFIECLAWHAKSGLKSIIGMHYHASIHKVGSQTKKWSSSSMNYMALPTRPGQRELDLS
jgi:hypothetical protein